MKPTLLIDTEHNEVILTQARRYLDSVAQAKHWEVMPDRMIVHGKSSVFETMLYSKMGYGRNNHHRFSRNKASVWSSKRPYWHLMDPDPVVLTFGLWDQAEMRHAKDVAVVRKLSREERKAAQAVSWGTVHGRGVSQLDHDFLKSLTDDDWVFTKTLNVKSEDWKPQGRLTIV